MTRSWFRPATPTRRPLASRPPRWRPTVESLEDRAVPATLTVDVNDPTANDPGDNRYAQIAEAVAAAAPGDQINVHAGTYRPFTVSTNNLTIREADETANPVVDATGVLDGVTVVADGVTIHGLTVANANRMGIVISGNYNTLQNNVATNNRSLGFGVLRLGTAERFAGNTLIGNTATGSSTGFALGNNDGSKLIGNVATGNNTGFDISGSNKTTVTNNQAIGNRQLGFFLTGGTRNRLIGNAATGGGLLGFQIGGTDGKITGNLASGNADTGFNIFRAQRHTLMGNVARGNGGTGFALNGASGTVLHGNVSEGNAGSGYSLNPFVSTRVTIISFPARTARLGVTLVEPSIDNTLQGNEATGNGAHGFYLRGASGNLLRGNSALDNGGDGFRVETFTFVAPATFGIFTLVNAGERLVDLPSDSNALQGNTAADNGGFGYYADVLGLNVFVDNDAENNTLGDANF